jgi:tRNA (guanine26-N2/guanine27-N2)-dimethyltransferase
MRFVEYHEGSTRLLVPPASIEQNPPPSSPVFFNPAAALNRDVSVAITAATDGRTFCDSMSGVGARGVRIATEVERVERVVLVDFNANALAAARNSAGLNGVAGKCVFTHAETSSFLYSTFGREEKFDYVDVDPFGTPVRQLQAALSSLSEGGILSVTATDTAVLCGVYPRVCERRYGALPLKNGFGHETGLRILVGAVARHGAQLDLGVSPVFVHSTRHYLRAYLRVLGGATKADECLESLGYIVWCPNCGHTEVADSVARTCLSCGKRAPTAGPLWAGGVTEPSTTVNAAAEAEAKGLASAQRTVESHFGIDDFPPWSFNIDGASSVLKAATAPESEVRLALADAGWRAMRTPFEKRGVKTDAPYEVFLGAVEEVVAKAQTVEGARTDPRR